MTKDIHEALFKLQGELRGVKKDSANPHFKNRYASLEQVTDTIRPHMQAVGLYWFQYPGSVIDGSLEITTRIIHASTGEAIEFTMQMPLAKRDPQGAGSAMTYAMRYSLMAALGLPPTDDDAETAIDRDNKRPEPEKKASKDDEARKLFTYLQNNFRAIDDTDQLKLWWKDFSDDRMRLPESWQQNLKDQWIKHGLSLKKDPVDDIVKQTGGKIVNDKFIEDFIDGK